MALSNGPQSSCGIGKTSYRNSKGCRIGGLNCFKGFEKAAGNFHNVLSVITVRRGKWEPLKFYPLSQSQDDKWKQYCTPRENAEIVTKITVGRNDSLYYIFIQLIRGAPTMRSTTMANSGLL